MRKLIYATNLTIDGCCDHRKGRPGEGMLEYYTRLVQDAGLIVYGRKTYQLMVPYWPDIAKNPTDETEAEIEYARAFDSVNKVVFSRSLDSTEDEKTRIVGTDLKSEILKLKQEPGKNILTTGGANFPSQLIELGLIDEYHIFIHPVFAGEGLRLLEGISLKENLSLKLVGSKTFKSGQIVLHYQKQ